MPLIRAFVLKLKHDIANDSELPLAQLESECLFGPHADPLRNLADLVVRIDALRESILQNSPSRVQDVLLRLPYPGAYQALSYWQLPEPISLGHIDRLTYFRDVFIFLTGPPVSVLSALSPRFSQVVLRSEDVLSPTGQRLSATVSVHQLRSETEDYAIRIIPAHCFLECSDHVVRLAQRVQDVDRMYEATKQHFYSNFSRPFAASVQMGFKWIEDFIDDRRPPNAYASHSLFGLRGRFFPRMARSLVNYLTEGGNGTVVDPFCGVGTLGIECGLLHIDSRSYDVNPFFVEVAKAKHQALSLAEEDVEVLERLREFSQELRGVRGGTGDLFEPRHEHTNYAFPSALRGLKKESVELLGLIQAEISRIRRPDIARVARLAIAYYASSMLKKYDREQILRSFWAHISRTLYLDRFMKRLYGDGIVRPPLTASYDVLDVRKLSEREAGLESILTSPPYTTAVDYVGNDLIGYYAMGLRDHEKVEADTIGSTRLGHVSASLANAWHEYLPDAAKKSHAAIAESNHRKAISLAKYFFDMTFALRQISASLVPGGKLALIVCGRQEFGRQPRIEYPVADAITQIGESTGLRSQVRIDIDLTKNSDGDIMQESVLIFDR